MADVYCVHRWSQDLSTAAVLYIECFICGTVYEGDATVKVLIGRTEGAEAQKEGE